jgi:signal transduction histidine kinase
MIRLERSNSTSGGIILAVVLTLILVWSGLLQKLLITNGFIPHGHCYLWKPGLVWLHVGSDTFIAVSYVAISVTLAYLVHQARQKIPFQWMFLAFGTFIVACGMTHLMEVWTLWHPIYWLSGGLKLITAIASVATAIALPLLVPKALALIESEKLSEERRLHLETANRELETLYGRLKELDQLKTQFFANVSHELRTPLTLILAPTEKLLTAEKLNEEQQRHLTIINRNARILLKQVNDLLDVSKLEAGKMQVDYSNINLAQLVHLTAANFDGLAQERHITFTVETPDVVPAQVDVEKVQRILLNLLSNAFKFTPKGGCIRCSLSISPTSDRTASSQTDAQREQAVIVIQDNGPGIPLELRNLIFERFQQGEEGITRRFGGTGLGLAIVKEFVELQGGAIAVEDVTGGGALFRVELPLVVPGISVSTFTIASRDLQETALSVLAELRGVANSRDDLERGDSVPPFQIIPLLSDVERQVSPRVERSIQALETEKPLVLVVEDNPEMGQFLSETLATEYRTITASNGQEGLEMALALHPDLILSDIMMPNMSGDQFVRQLQTYPELETTPVIVLTAKTDDDLRVELLRQGAQDYLMKPFSIRELQARVSNWIAIKRVRDLLQQELASQSQDLETLAQELTLRKRELQLTLEVVQQQAEKLLQANRLKDEFLGIISHELRTPLNLILGWAQVLRSRQLNEAKTAEALETIERNARAQNQLVDNLLDISRLQQGSLLLKKRPVNLQAIVQAALQAVQPGADTKAIQLTSELDSTIGLVFGDPRRLHQVVKHLLDNAIKFTPSGGQVDVRLSGVRSRESGVGSRESGVGSRESGVGSRESGVGSRESGVGSQESGVRSQVQLITDNGQRTMNYAQIRVRDTGQGIGNDVLPYIFDYFRQADSSLTRRFGGLGLGLAIARHLVELHDGVIRVESLGEGQGTTFIVLLPLYLY